MPETEEGAPGSLSSGVGGHVFQRLLVALDDSEAGEVALVFATALARRMGGDLHLFHVNEYVIAGRGMTVRSTADVRLLLGRAVSQVNEAGVAASGSSYPASSRSVPKCIVAEAQDRRADAIVLGSNRHHGLDRLFASRVRSRTTRLTSLPVLTAPSPLHLSSRAQIGLDELVRSEIEQALS